MTEDHSRKGKGLSLPGQPTEEAIAEVGSEAGKSLLRGLSRLGNAYTNEWAVRREARADAARLTIDTDAQIKTAAELTSARREEELAELEHRAALERRAARLRVELAREQTNLESIERRAVEYTERDVSNDRPREIDEDWLFKFADLAQKISDPDVQSLWARALSSASIAGATALSAPALQLLSLVDASVASQFRKFVAAQNSLGGMVPVCDNAPPLSQSEPQGIDLYQLRELGLITNIRTEDAFQVFGAMIGGTKYSALAEGERGVFGFSYRGHEIARAVFRLEPLFLSPELLMSYSKNIISQKARITGTRITPLKQEEHEIRLSIDLPKIETPWRADPVLQSLRPELVELLEWADAKFTILITSKGEPWQ
ncbi:DUF2806 domain-containing protein [Bradyrhizobium symbiodeficiens]|uniref:DUF2806 domain-containing protein n=1 Tax=Bradyrhizobium symbiodeficiens TaxID=1404367 RepID=A0A6G9A192_9BRAD|nr:DUF2806 domain-containing protein [Bradyrhizobium symbiodeficiens]QIP05983.1 DUF2806 domain-containing protein [Bradyrhizobium symbiodeficiens]